MRKTAVSLTRASSELGRTELTDRPVPLVTYTVRPIEHVFDELTKQLDGLIGPERRMRWITDCHSTMARSDPLPKSSLVAPGTTRTISSKRKKAPPTVVSVLACLEEAAILVAAIEHAHPAQLAFKPIYKDGAFTEHFFYETL